MSVKNSSDTIGKRAPELPACSAVPPFRWVETEFKSNIRLNLDFNELQPMRKRLNTWCFKNAYQNFRCELPTSKERENIYINVCRGTNPVFTDLKPLHLYQCGHLTTLVYSAPIKNGGTLYRSMFMPLKPFVTAPGPLTVRDCPWSEVSMQALVQVEDIASVGYTLWLDTQWQFKIY